MNAESWGFVVYFKPDRLLSADIREKRDMLIFYLWKNAGDEQPANRGGVWFNIFFRQRNCYKFRKGIYKNGDLEKKRSVIAKFKV